MIEYPSPASPSRVRVPARFETDLESQFHQSRRSALAAVNTNTFWAVALILLCFGLWDFYVDPANWVAPFGVRLAGAVLIVATGLFQKLPGRSQWMPLLAKVRLVIAVTAAAIAAVMLSGGYGFSVAGIVVILLTGPYIAIDTRDLLRINLIALGGVVIVILSAGLDRFNVVSTLVFVTLAAAVSTLLGRVLETSNRRAFALERELHRDSRTDSLTGLANRRAMEERGPLELKRAARTAAPVSVILCDVDHFKSINDRHGHEVGDAVLRTTAAVLRGALRETDALARWGGEEFIAVLTDADTRAASEVAERMRSAVSATRFPGLADTATISLGVATVHKVQSAPAAWDALIKEADQLLYQAKKEGRNRVMYPQA